MFSRFVKNKLQKLADENRSVFGFRVVTEATAEEARNSAVKIANLVAAKQESEKALRDAKHRIGNLEQTIEVESALKSRAVVDPFMADPSPKDTEQRKLYVAQVAGLHKDILEPKLRHMIAKAFLMLEESSNDREFDQAVKGTIYALREIIRWGESMLNEQLALQTQKSDEITK